MPGRLIPIGEQHFRRAVAEYVATPMENGMIRAATIASSRARRSSGWRVACDGIRDSAGCSSSMSERRDRQIGREMEHYGFVRSIKEECLNRLIPLGERHNRRAIVEFPAHYHRERNH